ncbi:hypothetical protein RB195_024338 [Necator americanus]|uniref:Uncharacterized protein n=1 Tax=Necator americanus TaxID=51031 RepID=A0ABR1EMR5_NECAM
MLADLDETWMHRSLADSAKDNVHAERMGLRCSIYAHGNKHVRMYQLRSFGSGIEHDERPDPRAKQEETWEHLLLLCSGTSALAALTYASETWAFCKQEENAVSVIERAVERVMLGVSRFIQVRDGTRFSVLRQRLKIRDVAAFAKESEISALQEDRRLGRPISSRSSSKKIVMPFMSHTKGGTAGRFWHAIGTNGRNTGARSTSSKINGSQGNEADQELTAVLTQTTSLSSSQCTVYNGTMNRDEFNGAESRRVFAETQELEFSIAWRYSRERRRNFYVSSELLKKLLKALSLYDETLAVAFTTAALHLSAKYGGLITKAERNSTNGSMRVTECLVLMLQKNFAFAFAETRSTYNSVWVARSTGDFNNEKRLRRKFSRHLQQDRDNEWTLRGEEFEKAWEDKKPMLY